MSKPYKASLFLQSFQKDIPIEYMNLGERLDSALMSGSGTVEADLVMHIVRCIYSKNGCYKNINKPNGDADIDGQNNQLALQNSETGVEKKVYLKFVHNFLYAVARDLVHKCNERKKEANLPENPMSKKIVENCSHFNLYVNLLEQLRSEDRYIIINSMTNHLRYPNIFTYFFHMVLVQLFKSFPESGRNEIREIILRILVERLIAHLPHPWGLNMTYLAMIEIVQEEFTETQQLPPFMRDRKIEQLVMAPAMVMNQNQV